MAPVFSAHVSQRHMVLLRGKHPMLVDTGFGSDLPETIQLLRDAGVAPEQLELVINTHYHSDHTGGNSGLQERYNIPIAAHVWDAAMINGRDWEACSVDWLNQPVEPYEVQQALDEGSEISLDKRVLKVLHTPGHTLGHIVLYEPDEQVLSQATFCTEMMSPGSIFFGRGGGA